MKPPTEAELDDALVRQLLQSQFPAWASLEFTHVDGGWNNEMYRLGRDLAVRIPRRLIRTAHECPTSGVGMPRADSAGHAAGSHSSGPTMKAPGGRGVTLQVPPPTPPPTRRVTPLPPTAWKEGRNNSLVSPLMIRRS